MFQNRISTTVLACSFFVLVNTGAAHEIFQDVMKETYGLKSFSCKACHPDSKDRKQMSPFAKLIHQELKGQHYSEKFAVAEAKGEEAVTEFDKLIAKDFKKAIKVVGQKKMTFDDLIQMGMFSGARLDPKKMSKKIQAEEP